MKALFHPEAEREFLDYVRYYESKVAGLGDALIDEAELLIQLICTHPKSWPTSQNPDIRRATMRQFPLSIVYRIQPDSIQVLAFAHDRRQPGYWLERHSRG
ncbi:type II toxin-antitoxin system RelE/ParE family toxin [Saccharospirillum mangrovi]|uniref:type II toxin-antitoxin system RelE/ParE family toxin n=1 Tax=Saccharospirillum mangrovi TaxID=2161747 RepID=UPI000D3B135E|nr:type II toxin-antitoxin system RelE/ParE family toxin [Saccharospirillum mangrovi]